MSLIHTLRNIIGLGSRVAAVLMVACLALVPAGAQVYYGTIRGTVLDPAGALHPGVDVTLANLDTNIAHKAISNEVGNYTVPNLIPGRYRVTAESAGFKKFVAESVDLAAGQDFRVDIRLEIGSLTESVTVSGGAQLIETERATISDGCAYFTTTRRKIP